MALFIVERRDTGFSVRSGENTLQAAASALTAEAWAEGTLPGGAGTKSAKEHANEAAASAASAETAALAMDTSQRWYLVRKQALFGQCDTDRTAQLAVFLDGSKQDFTITEALSVGTATIDQLNVAGGSITAPDRLYLFRREVAVGIGDSDMNAQFATFVDGSTSESVRQGSDAAATGGIVCWGDSLTQGTGPVTPYPAYLAAATGRDVLNLGIGGQQGYQIAARMGAIGVPMTVSGNSLSAGANTVTAIDGTAPRSVLPFPSEFFYTNLQLLSTQDANARSIRGTLGSVRGTLNRTATLAGGSYTAASTETYTFTPDAGETLPAKVPAGSVFVAEYEQDDRTHVFWLFRNNYTDLNYLDVMDACIRRIGHGRYVIMPVINGNNAGERSSSADPTNYNTIRAIEDALTNRYAGRVLNIRRLLIDKGLTALGITPTAQDLTDIADDTVPNSLRQDSIHLIDAAYEFVADEVTAFLTLKGY